MTCTIQSALVDYVCIYHCDGVDAVDNGPSAAVSVDGLVSCLLPMSCTGNQVDQVAAPCLHSSSNGWQALCVMFRFVKLGAAGKDRHTLGFAMWPRSCALPCRVATFGEGVAPGGDATGRGNVAIAVCMHTGAIMACQLGRRQRGPANWKTFFK